MSRVTEFYDMINIKNGVVNDTFMAIHGHLLTTLYSLIIANKYVRGIRACFYLIMDIFVIGRTLNCNRRLSANICTFLSV